MTFGIPKDAIPVQEDGSIDLSHHHRILEVLKRREQKGKEEHKVSTSESSPVGASAILVPGPMDVLMGRGLRPKRCPGSLRLHHLLLENMDAYDAADSKFEKTVRAETVVQQMKDSGCRFLNVTPDGLYTECDNLAARAKISHGFRNLRNKMKSSGTKNRNDASRSNIKRSREV
jgi:hypothetical protein